MRERKKRGGGGAFLAVQFGCNDGEEVLPARFSFPACTTSPPLSLSQLVDVEAWGPPVLEYDEEWLAVMRSTHQLTNLSSVHRPLPVGLKSESEGEVPLKKSRGPDPADVAFVRDLVEARGGSIKVPNGFVQTAKPHGGGGGKPGWRGRMPTKHVRNPQTEALLGMLGLPYNLDHDSVPVKAASPGAGALL
jgi:hypothetical protein